MLSTTPLQATPHLDASVREVLHQGYVIVPADVPLTMVAAMMATHRIHAVLVSDRLDPLGWVTSRGMLFNHSDDWDHARAGQAISEPVTEIGSDQTVARAIELMVASNATHLLVRDYGRAAPLGVIADSDLVRFMGRQWPHEMPAGTE